jgi:hypothetical protein
MDLLGLWRPRAPLAQGRRPLLLDVLPEARHAEAERMNVAELAAPNESVAVMRVATKPKKAAEQSRRNGVAGPNATGSRCDPPSVLTAADTDRGKKYLFEGQIQATLLASRRPFGECRLIRKQIQEILL